MKKVLIFGASGFVGSYLAQEFMNNGYCVYGTDKVQGNWLDKNVKFCISDLLKADEVENVINRIKPYIIVNLAAISSVGMSWKIPQTTMDVNVIGALNIMEAVKKSECESKILFVGSSEEYIVSDKKIDEKTELNANNPYGISKIAQEQFAKLYREQYGMKIYCVRPFNHTGIGQKDTFVLPSFCKQVAEIEKGGKSGTIHVGNLSAKRDFSHVKDIVRAYRLIVESDNCKEIYNVGSGKAYGIDEMLDYIIGLSSQNITIEVDSDLFRPCDQPIVCCNSNLITSNLGWTPNYTVFDALKEMYQNYLK